MSPVCQGLTGSVSIASTPTAKGRSLGHKDFTFQPTYVQISPLALGMPGELVLDLATKKVSLRMINWQWTLDCKTQGNECVGHLAGMRDDLRTFQRSMLQSPEDLIVVNCALERIAEFEAAVAPVHQL